MAKASSNTSVGGGPGSRVAGNSNARSIAVFWSILGAACVFGAFVAYAYLAPATYRTEAKIELDAPKPALEELPPPEAAIKALKAAVLNQELFAELARLLGSDTPGTRLQVANAVKSGLTVSSTDARVFTFTFEDSNPERAQKACNLVARRAAEVSPQVLLKVSVAQPSPKNEKLAELLAFLEKHPEVGAFPGSADARPEAAEPKAPKSEANDLLIQALSSERQVALAELEKLQAVDPNNPYADGVEAEKRALGARLRELNEGIAARRKGLQAAKEQGDEPRQEVSEEVSKHWAKLLRELMTAPQAKPVEPAPAAKGVVVSEAEFPRWPVEPDRQLLLLLGSLASLVVAAAGVTHGVVSGRRGGARPSESPPRNTGPDPVPPAAHGAFAPNAVPPAQAGPPEPSPPPGASVTAPLEAPPAPPAQPLPPGAGTTAPIEPAPAAKQAAGPEAEQQSPAGVEQPYGGLGQTVVMGSGKPEQVGDKDLDQKLPRTVLGGFGATPGAAAAAAAQIPRPISVRGQTVVEAIEAAQATNPDATGAQAKPGGGDERVEAQASPPVEVQASPPVEVQASPPVEVQASPPVEVVSRKDDSDEEPQRYRAPARKRTQMLGSPTWVQQGGVQGGGTVPARPAEGSGRYRYVSDHPGPGPAGLHPPEQGPSTALARPQQRLPLVATHPPPPGWNLNQGLAPATLDPVCQALASHRKHGSLVVGVAGFAELLAEKSRLAAGIAIALSREAKHRVLLVEGDFQSPSAHRSLGVEMPISAGLSQQLQLRRSKNRTNEPPWVVIECAASLHLLGEGVIRSPGAILSQQYEHCLTEVRSNYDFVIVDGPAVTSEVESRAFSQLIDGVVLGTPRAGMQLPPEIHAIFHGRQFVLSHPCRS